MQGWVPSIVWDVLHVQGPGAGTFLDRMLSNRVGDLDAERAAGAFLLEPTGRVVSGAVFVPVDDGLLALCPGGLWRERLGEGLSKYRIAEPIEFVAGPERAVLWLEPPATHLPAAPYDVVRTADGLGVRIPVTGLGEVAWLGPLPAGLPELHAADATAERIAAGVPAFDHELDQNVIPLEAGATDWLSATKGCYVGQEVIERMWSRDRAARRLCGLEGTAAPGGALPLKLQGDGGLKGTLTSAAEHPSRGWIGLGLLNTVADGQAVHDEHGGSWRLRPLPFDSARMVSPREER